MLGAGWFGGESEPPRVLRRLTVALPVVALVAIAACQIIASTDSASELLGERFTGFAWSASAPTSIDLNGDGSVDLSVLGYADDTAAVGVILGPPSEEPRSLHLEFSIQGTLVGVMVAVVQLDGARTLGAARFAARRTPRRRAPARFARGAYLGGERAALKDAWLASDRREVGRRGAMSAGRGVASTGAGGSA